MLSRILEDFATSVWVERVGWTLLHSLWQIFLIVSAYYLLSFQLRKNSAFCRYITGCTALVGYWLRHWQPSAYCRISKWLSRVLLTKNRTMFRHSL